MHGAVGLWNGNVNGYDKKEMLMEKLVADGAISEQTFSFYLDGQSGDSYVDFGAPNTSVMSTSSVAYIPILEETHYWSSKITGFRWGSSSNGDDTEYAVREADGRADTGQGCIFGPLTDIKPIIYMILSTVEPVYAQSGWDYLFDCDKTS